MNISLSDDFLIGIDTIDEQHKEFFNLVNELFETCTHNKCKRDIDDIFKKLGDYIAFHFSEEERLHLETRYPGYKEHKIAHLNFIEFYKELKKNYYSSGSDPEIVKQLKTLLVDWLIQHITHADKQFAEYYKEKTKK